MGEQVDLSVFLNEQVSFGFFEGYGGDEEFALGEKIQQIITDIEAFESSDQFSLFAVPTNAVDFEAREQGSSEGVQFDPSM